MTLRIFSVAGEALHFGARRMETLMRVGWLPVSLLFIAQMTTLYGVLSVQAGRLVTATDLSVQIDQATRVVRVEGLVAQMARALFNAAMNGRWDAISPTVWIILAVSIVVQTALVAALVAPMTRLAGLGEEPSRGVFRLHFGEDELRFSAVALGGFLVLGAFVVGPMVAAAYFTLKSVADAYGAHYAIFPNPDSLHTIVEKTGRELIEERGEAFAWTRGVPLAAMAPVALLVWGVLFQHFRPRGVSPARAALSGLMTLVAGGAVVSVAWLLVLAGRGNVAPGRADSLFFGFEALAVVILYYLSLRMVPVAGVAVCRRSFRSGSFLKTTARWNILRLGAILAIVGAVLIAMQTIINSIGWWAVQSVVQSAYGAVSTMTGWSAKGGEPAAWVLPTFLWVWTGLKVLYNLFWLFFTYGVLSGLLGRLYRESERGDGEHAADAAIWMKKA